jgi:ribosomal protein S18 acetylase RimI-like enzyme
MVELAVRSAVLADASAIAGLHLRSWRHAYKDLAPREAWDTLTESVRRDRWAAMLGAPRGRHHTFVAETGGCLLGIGTAAPPSEAAFGARGEIRSLYVEPDAARMGIGRRLLGEVAARLVAFGFEGAALGVVIGNEPAIAFYESLGGRRAGTYLDPGPVWRSENLVIVWDDARALADLCLHKGS